MDFMKEFEAYLPKWAEQKMQPIPTRDHPDRWSLAWKDFVTEELTKRKDEIIEEYRNMKFKTVGDVRREKKAATEKVSEQVELLPEPKEEKPLTEWEKVQAMMKDM